MQETTNQAKPTPTRRRQGRGGGGKAAGQKMYASENDLANVPSIAYEQNGHPHTPQKSYSGSPEPQSGTGNQTGSKQRSRNKPRTKNPNTVASPDVTRQNRRSTPQNIPSTPSQQLLLPLPLLALPSMPLLPRRLCPCPAFTQSRSPNPLARGKTLSNNHPPANRSRAPYTAASGYRT
ncbi:proteophosphoglycan 5 [Colletotrichum tofieldiae]|nr:proteophosphoglycan 5 [Colletotrichum tofieldiae]